MPIRLNEQYAAVVIELEGRFLGSVDGQAFRDALVDLRAAGKKNVVVDLEKAHFIDSSGIGALISGLTSMRMAGGEIRLARMEQRVKNVFLVTRLLGPVFEHYDTVEAAVDSYIDHPPEPPPEAN